MMVIKSISTGRFSSVPLRLFSSSGGGITGLEGVVLAGRRFFGGVELVGRGDALRRRVPLRLKPPAPKGLGWFMKYLLVF